MVALAGARCSASPGRADGYAVLRGLAQVYAYFRRPARCGQDVTAAGDVYARFRTTHPPTLGMLPHPADASGPANLAPSGGNRW
jgi:hypothetical protein